MLRNDAQNKGKNIHAMRIVISLFRLINLPAAHTGSSPSPFGAVIDGATLSGDGGVHLGRSLLVLLGVELPEVALTVALLAAELVTPGGLAPGGLLTPGTPHLHSCIGINAGRGNHHVPVALAQAIAASLRQLCACDIGSIRVNVGALPTDLINALLGVPVRIDLTVVALTVPLEVSGRLTTAVFDRAEELGPAGLRPNPVGTRRPVGFVGLIELG